MAIGSVRNIRVGGWILTCNPLGTLPLKRALIADCDSHSRELIRILLAHEGVGERLCDVCYSMLESVSTLYFRKLSKEYAEWYNQAVKDKIRLLMGDHDDRDDENNGQSKA